ncbi:ABC-F family ATP-binding cassette domain-containing protein [Calothrix sp. NIES-3974]|uniref:ABC-F family ATP-binding cassette domain-containing protein n=1 Tax=Calothrix sp. NIES-3974 TaxID=2005462 RepID=UPI000B62139A|nr:ABC-F family ATP-binding cassette domain-containing protein [Calothrix sp. NIES-3974]BAZ06023.1 ABC transporter ATP-binding protein [Calothrix sp. NIES-3974]
MLNVRAIQINFGLQEVLKNISFGLNAGEVIAITGANGAGKSSLLKCIAGTLAPSSGEIQLQKGIHFAYLPQSRPTEKQSVMEFLLRDFPEIHKSYQKMHSRNIETIEYANAITEYLEIGGYELESKFARLLLSFGFDETDLSRELQDFSEGQKQIFPLLQILASDAQLLILDEPTNHLDISMCLYLEKVICKEKQKGRSFIVVSHDRVFVDKIADRTLYIQRGESILVRGGYSQLLVHLEQDFQSRQELAVNIQDKIKKLETEARRKKVWAGRKEKEKNGAADKGFIGARAAKLAKRAKVVEQRQQQMLETLKAEKPFVEKKLNLSFADYTVANKHILSAQNLSKKFGERAIFENVSLELTTQDRVAIIGDNGSGKTTLMKCLLGYEQASSGQIHRNNYAKWLYFPQNIQDYFTEKILLHNLMSYGVEEAIVRQFLGAAKLRRERVLQPISTLSYGELMRAAIVSAILASSEFLFLDEPTNHLDIESLEVLDQLLCQFPGGLLFISHDRQFIAKNALTILSIESFML